MMVRFTLYILLLLVSCASMARGPGAATPGTPGGPDGGATPEDGGTASVSPPSDGGGMPPVDRGAEADFGTARTQFERGDHQAARASLEALIEKHPTGRTRNAADIMLGRLALGRGDAAGAKKILAPMASSSAIDDDMGAAARYYLGLTELRLGNAAKARDLLSPFLPKTGGGAAPETPAPPDDASIELRGALAEALAGSGDPAGALELWEAYFRLAREHEKAWARGRADEAVARLTPEAAWRAYGAAPSAGLGRAVLGSKAAAHLRAKGDTGGAAFIDSETATARRVVGFEMTPARVGPGDPTRIGLAIPLSGKFQVVGEAALRAAMLAGGAPGGAGGAAAQLVVRDTATDPERAARGVAELTRSEAVIAIVGGAGAKTGAAAAAQATQDGIPLVALEDTAPGALSTAFQVMHAPEARAAALANHALKLGARKFALLGPDSAGGKRLREAFRRAVTAGGGTVVADSSYVAGATSFSAAVAPVKKASPEAVFVPDSAERLELIAPALAVADLWPQPWGKPRPRPAAAPAPGGAGGAAAGAAKGGGGAAGGGSASGAGTTAQPVLLLSTASELSPRLVQAAGRYVQGALLCPGFFAAESDPRARAFVEAYRAAYGQDPHAAEAYAYDAVTLLRTAVDRGARTRTDLVKALAGAGNSPVLQGLTGNVTFGPDHSRVDPPLVYVVDGDGIRAPR